MERILVCSDFSPAAVQALDYAVQMAKECNAKILLFHSFMFLPSGMIRPSVDEVNKAVEEMEKTSHEQLQDLVKPYEKTGYINQSGFINFEFSVRNGSAAEEIADMMEKQKIDLVILGNRKASSVNKAVFGSVTADLLKMNLSCPILSIPEGVVFKNMDKITYASKLGNEDAPVIDQLLKFTSEFRAKLDCVFVSNGEVDDPNLKKWQEKYYFTEKSKIDFHIIYSDNIQEGLNNYVNKSESDILAMLTHSRNFFQRLIEHSYTSSMLFYANVPILIFKQAN